MLCPSLDCAYASPKCWRRPPDRPWHRRIEREPAALNENFRIDVAVEMRAMPAKADENEPNRVAGGEQHRAKQDRHIVAVAGFELEHAARGVKQLHPKNVS